MVRGRAARPSRLLRPRRGGERLSAADASNIELDSPEQVNAFLMAGLLGEGGFVTPGGIDLAALRTAVQTGISGAPEGSALARFGQRVEPEGRTLVWRACPVELDWHVRLADPVRGREGLAELAASLMTSPLAPHRPGWEILIVPGAGAEGDPRPPQRGRRDRVRGGAARGRRRVDLLRPEPVLTPCVRPHSPGRTIPCS